MSFTTSHDGLSLFYDTFGDGPPLLIINGFGPPCEWMAEMYGKHFKDRFTCAVADLRGVGQSERPKDLSAIDLTDFAKDHLAVMDALGWEAAFIYGGSMGASISAQLALLAPERVKRLVLGSFDCGYPNVMSQPYRHIIETRVRYGRSILAQKTHPEQAAQTILDTYYGDPDGKNHPGVFDFIVNMLKAHPMQTDFPPLQTLRSMPDNITSLLNALPHDIEPIPSSEKPARDFITGDLWEQVHEMKPPTLLLHGYDDHIIPYQSAVYAASKMPRSELRLYKPMYHSISGSPDILREIGDWFLRP